MKKIHFNAIKGLAVSVSALALVTGGAAFAQDNDEGEENVCEYDAQGRPTGVSVEDPNCEVDSVAPQADGTATGNQIVVTGSRIQRDDTYSSISPLQVLDTQTLQDTGQFDAAQILQQSESAAGEQIDATFQGFVLNNGPGSQTLNLRGLGPDRTLLLINGRRIAPSGVEGAPSNPSINLIPSSLVARYDLLLDGASSVYGSDAVAGVGNIVLRRDIDGLELFASGDINEEAAGNDYQISAAWGKVGSNWNFGIGAEYSYRDEIKLSDRQFLAGCDTNYEIDQNGNILTVDLGTAARVENRTPGVTTSTSPCKITSQVGRIILPYQTYGSVYYTPGAGNSGIPNFNESSITVGGRTIDIDADGDGLADVDFFAIDRNGSNPDQTFISGQKLYNVMAYGEYSFGGDFNVTPFFEANYSRAEVDTPNSGSAQLFPYVPAFNQFNPCFRPQDGGSGVDCPAAELALLGRPGVNSGLSLPTQTVVAVRGDRDNVFSVLEQYRGVVGLKGDLPFIDFGPGNDWTFEVAGVYSRSEGSAVRRGIREDKLALSLGLDPTADYDGDGIFDNDGDGIADDYQNLPFGGVLGGPTITACNTAALANPGAALPDLAAGCVPVNLFAPSLLGVPIGDFATQAERDYLIGERTFDTTYEQTIISAYIQGSVFELPGGTAKAVLGGEYRDDTIQSIPDAIASNGLFWGFFADQGAVGSKDIYEVFGELDLPLVSGETLAEDIRLNLSGRITDEEFYGTAGTYSIKLGWRPFQQLLLKMSYGTSFRAPNLRENFLAGQTGFLTLTDPCAVPGIAYDTSTGAYLPGQDPRDPAILANCRREGRDPTRVGVLATSPTLAPINTSSTEIISGGSLALEPETSDSFTTGFAFAEAFGPIDFSFNFNYYNISVKGAVVEPSPQFILNDCFTREDGIRSPFCDRITTDTDPSTRLLVSDVFAGFINLNEERVEGIDLNANFSSDLSVAGRDVRLGLNLRANHLIQRSTLFIDDSGAADLDEQAGEFGFPSWTGRATFSASTGPVTFTWQTRFIGRVEQDPLGIDPLADAFGGGPDGNLVDEDGNLAPDFTGDTCLGDGSRFLTGPNRGQLNGVVAGDGVFCRDVGFADEYFVHTASVRYEFSDFLSLRVGVANVFNTTPPLIDTNEVFGISNIPIGNGYDLDGREYFGSVSVRF